MNNIYIFEKSLNDIKETERKEYLITSGLTPSSGKARKARSKTLKEVLNQFNENEFITIHEDGRCIFQGYTKYFQMDIKEVI
ncbi:hypothetical protein [Oceanobacillus kimchii]|uniref:Uncharacterized protein n=1 Tax=Oceanobacillus kimchii TaxID=746691 RepID=A0ABQ5TK97_9BACI|nr:hypothetical protein [Oceanobacillus kimchii]GLO66161.1 hypothetical protein MACH08_19450 [Oceanobacillus kimchii]